MYSNPVKTWTEELKTISAETRTVYLRATGLNKELVLAHTVTVLRPAAPCGNCCWLQMHEYYLRVSRLLAIQWDTVRMNTLCVHIIILPINYITLLLINFGYFICFILNVCNSLSRKQNCRNNVRPIWTPTLQRFQCQIRTKLHFIL